MLEFNNRIHDIRCLDDSLEEGWNREWDILGKKETQERKEVENYVSQTADCFLVAIGTKRRRIYYKFKKMV